MPGPGMNGDRPEDHRAVLDLVGRQDVVRQLQEDQAVGAMLADAVAVEDVGRGPAPGPPGRHPAR